MAALQATADLPSAPLDFDQSEYDDRIRAVQRELADRGGDLLLVDQIDHLAYLFGYLATAARYQAALIPADGKPWLIVRELDLGTFLDQSWCRSFETFADDEDSHERVAQAIRRLAPKTLAVEKDSNILTIARLEQIQAVNPGTTIVDFSGVLWQQRLVKSATEIAYIRRAAEIADHIISAGLHSAAERHIDRATLAAMYAASIRHGGDNVRSAIIGRLGGEDALVGRVNGTPWRRGERIFLEATPQYRGYSARVIRTASIGPEEPASMSHAGALAEIQDEQIKAMIPGALGRDIDALCRSAVLSSGLKSTFPQITGYTLGYQAVPRVSDHTRIIAPDQNWTVQPGMVFHVVLHTPLAAISETVIIGDQGPERLSTLPRTVVSK
jgi:Xaa-Pro aminopeptidase